MTVYLDMIWLLNFLFDSLLIYLTAVVLRREIKILKIFIAGFTGSLVVFLPFTPFAWLLSSPLFKIGISFFMIFLAFGFRRIRYFITNVSVFYLLTFSIGGALIATHYLLNFQLDLSLHIFMANIRGFGDPVSWLFVIIGFPTAYYFSKETFTKWKSAKIRYDQLVDVTISVNNEEIRLKGMVDSGNQLYDPLTKIPVMVVSLQKTAGLFPDPVLKVFKDVNELWKHHSVPEQWTARFSVVPYRAVGNDNGLLACIKPDYVIIQDESARYETNQVLIAFVDQTLSSDALFDCIVHPEMMQTKGEHVS